MTVRTPEGAWVVPTNRGVWVPAGTRHSIQMSGCGVAANALPGAAAQPLVARQPRVIGISPLLRELILRIVELDSLSPRNPEHAHLVSVLLDHLHVMQSDAVHLPLPRDARAKRIAAMLQKQPSDTRSLGNLSRVAGASKRTIERRFKVETGLGFGKWRQQLRLGHALRLLAAGRPRHDGRDGGRL